MWTLTKEGLRALAWGYIKPPMPVKRARAAPGTKALKKRKAAKGKK